MVPYTPLGHEVCLGIRPIRRRSWSPRVDPSRCSALAGIRAWSPIPHWGTRFADCRTMCDTSVPIPRIMRVLIRCALTRRVLIVSVLMMCVRTGGAGIVSIEIVSVLIIGGRMMRVRRIEAPGRALAWSEMVRTPRRQIFFA